MAEQVVVRFPSDLLAKLDRYLVDLHKERPDIAVTRSAAVRALVAEALRRKDDERKAAKR